MSRRAPERGLVRVEAAGRTRRRAWRARRPACAWVSRRIGTVWTRAPGTSRRSRSCSNVLTTMVASAASTRPSSIDRMWEEPVRVGPGDGLLAGHPQVVEVDRQEDHLGGRRHVVDEVDDVDGHGRPVEQGHVTGGRQALDGLAQRVVVVDPGDRDPESAQGARVRILGLRERGEEGDVEPGPGQDLQMGVRARRPGVAIRGGQRVVDQQEALTHARIVGPASVSFGIRSNRCSIACHTGPMAGGMNKRGGHGYGTMAERIAATKAAAAPPSPRLRPRRRADPTPSGTAGCVATTAGCLRC